MKTSPHYLISYTSHTAGHKVLPSHHNLGRARIPPPGRHPARPGKYKYKNTQIRNTDLQALHGAAHLLLIEDDLVEEDDLQDGDLLWQDDGLESVDPGNVVERLAEEGGGTGEQEAACQHTTCAGLLPAASANSIQHSILILYFCGDLPGGRCGCGGPEPRCVGPGGGEGLVVVGPDGVSQLMHMVQHCTALHQRAGTAQVM